MAKLVFENLDEAKDYIKKEERRSIDRVLKAIIFAIGLLEVEQMGWRRKYDLVFSSDVIGVIREEYPYKLDWYDPDTTYEDDTRAFVRYLKDEVLPHFTQDFGDDEHDWD